MATAPPQLTTDPAAAAEEAEEIVARLPPAELSRFRQWFAAFDGELWDAQIEADAAAGKLDALAAEALANYYEGEVPASALLQCACT